MKFNEYPFIRYALFFIIGILLYPFSDFLGRTGTASLTSFLFLTYLTLLAVDSSHPSYRFKASLPILAYALLVSTGLLFTFLKDVKNDPSHLLHQGKIDGYLGHVDDLDEKKPNTRANRLRVFAVKKGDEYLPATGEVIIYHKLSEKLMPGEVVWVQGNPSIILPPKNPGEFNYGQFLANQQIHHSHFIDSKIERIGKANHSPINMIVLQLRESVQERIDRYIHSPHSNQIAKALLLGQKKELEPEVSEAYITAGTMHVLAVSGLHVGIIYGFFFLFIKPHQLAGRRRVLYLSFVILIIWLYALITGLSPSVLRAATMFTLMGLAQMKSRSPSMYNALALSALVLLVFDPFIIFSVGFQLSYAAVFGIVLLQPKIAGLWLPKSRVLDYFWQITSVGVAAQLTTFPISAHYFHVFPTYFMISNLIAIPGAFLIMSFGLPFMLFSFLEPMGDILGKMVDFIIRIENGLIFSFQKLPWARVENIHLGPSEMFLFWAIVACIYLLVLDSKRIYAYLSLLLFLGLAISNWLALWTDYQRNELYIYQLGKEVAVDHFYRGKLYSMMGAHSPQEITYKVTPNRIKLGHSRPQVLSQWEKDKTISVFLPDGSLLQSTGAGFELAVPFVKSISQYGEEKWLAWDESQAMEASFRIVVKR